MIKLLKKWWKPSKFTVTYCIRFEWNYYDKFSYDNIEDAKKRQEYLLGLDEEALLAEGFQLIPNYIRMEQVTGPNPISRLLNITGRKSNWKMFGYRI